MNIKEYLRYLSGFLPLLSTNSKHFTYKRNIPFVPKLLLSNVDMRKAIG